MAPESMSGVEQEIRATPNGHGCPGFGFGPTADWPRKKSDQARVGATGGRSLNTVWVATKGTVATVLSMVLLWRLAFPRISEALERRQRAIEDSIEAAERTRREADELLDEYRQRLAESRKQAEEIVQRARNAAEVHERDATEEAKARREQLMEQTRREIEAETRRAIDEIRREVADLTVMATEKVTRKVLDEEDQRRLVEEALSELDFSTLSASEE